MRSVWRKQAHYKRVPQGVLLGSDEVVSVFKEATSSEPRRASRMSKIFSVVGKLPGGLGQELDNKFMTHRRFDQMTRAIINQFSILTGNYHIRDLLGSKYVC